MWRYATGRDAGSAAWHAYCAALESAGGARSGHGREEALKNINVAGICDTNPILSK